MKSVKNDTKYIIKRILIGVGIAIILFNLKKCNVYADSNVRTFCNNGNTATSTWTYYDEDINCSHKTYNNSSDSFTYNGYKYNVGWYSSLNSDKPMLLVFEYNNEPYVTYGNLTSIPTGDDWYINITANSNQNNITLYTTGDNVSFTPGFLPYFSNNYFENGVSTSGGIVYTNLNTDENINFQNVKQLSRAFFLEHYQDLKLIYSTYDFPVYVNGSYEVPPVPNPLANLTQIDLTNHYGVLLVPKDYRTMLSDYSTTEEVAPGVFHTFLNLSYYSQYCTRGTLLNVENVQDILMNHTGVGSGSLATTINGTCPEQPTETTLSYQYDIYSGMTSKALFIYNNSLNWQEGFDNNAEGYYGTSYVWYDSTLYNMYIVDSFENFNATIQYIDYTGQQKEITIESLPTMEQSIESALDALENEENIPSNTSKLQAIFTFIKTPFTFLAKLNTNSCKAISLPFPHSNQNITINCLSSSVYDRYLPQALKGILIIIINGLLFYRCTLSNIDIVTDILDPEDNKLEAIQL